MMMGRHCCLFIAISVLLLIVSSCPASASPRTTAARATSSAPPQWHLPHRLVSFGDVHGDIENALALLRHAQIVDCDGHWIAGPATVIQTGDVVDRGNHPHEIIEYFQQLKLEAAEHGGEFIQLIGNHEIMNLRGDDKFVTPALLNAFGGEKGWKSAFSTSGRYGKILANLDTIVVRNNTAFVHAGLLPQFASRVPEETNAMMRKVIHEQNWGHDLVMNDGPVWTRTQIHQAMRGQCSLVRNALKSLSDANVRHGLSGRAAEVHRIVVGHTIQTGGVINLFCNSTLVAQDIAISQYMQGGGHLGFVEFRHSPQLDQMMPMRYYPPVADLRHKLTLPMDPSKVAGGSGNGGWFGSGDGEFDDSPNTVREGGANGAGNNKGSQQRHSEKNIGTLVAGKRMHHPPSLSHEDVSLALVAMGVVAWRVYYAYRKRKDVGAHKKRDDAPTTTINV